MLSILNVTGSLSAAGAASGFLLASASSSRTSYVPLGPLVVGQLSNQFGKTSCASGSTLYQPSASGTAWYHHGGPVSFGGYHSRPRNGTSVAPLYE